MTISWLKYSMIGLIGAASLVACTVTTDDDGDDDDGFGGDGGEDSAGRSGSAGSTGGGGRGGAGSGGGGTGGSQAGAGGSGGDETLTCETSGPTSEPFDSCDLTDVSVLPAACRTCLQSLCCSEVRNCYGTDPLNVCGYGGPDARTEYICYLECLEEAARDGGGSYDPEVDRPACEMACRTPAGPNGAPCSAVGDHTNALALCVHDSCEDECILAPASM